MKYALFCALCALLLVPVGGHAQNVSDQESVAVTADVLDDLSVTSTGASSLAFGFLLKGEQVSVPFDGGSAVRFAIKGGHRTSVLLGHFSFDLANQLDGTAGEMPFEYDLRGSDVNDPATAVALASGQTVTLNDDGEYFLWVGGSLNVPLDQAPGPYRSSLSVTVDYN